MTDTELDWGVGSGLKRDTAVVTLCTLVSRVSGFGRVIATAAVLGSGLLGDVYQSANLVPNGNLAPSVNRVPNASLVNHARLRRSFRLRQPLFTYRG